MALTETYANRRRAVKGIMIVKYTMAKSHNVSTVELQVLLLLGLSDSIYILYLIDYIIIQQNSMSSMQSVHTWQYIGLNS